MLYQINEKLIKEIQNCFVQADNILRSASWEALKYIMTQQVSDAGIKHDLGKTEIIDPGGKHDSMAQD